MKRRELLQYLNQHNCKIIDEVGPHTAVMNFDNGKKSYVPRHKELKRGLVRGICKQLEIPVPF